MLKILLILSMNLLIFWCIYKDIKDKYIEAKNDFEESITGQVILFKEGKLNGIVRYTEESNEVTNHNPNIKVEGW